MQYTEIQKKKLSEAILPHTCVEGGTLLVDTGNILLNGKDKITSDLSTYNQAQLIVPIELLKPAHEEELKQQLAHHMVPLTFRSPNIRRALEEDLNIHIDVEQREKNMPNDPQFKKMLEKIKKAAHSLAQKYHHADTPYEETASMKERKKSMAEAFARSCPEEAEMLYYKNLDDTHKKVSILLTDNSIPTSNLSGGWASGIAVDAAILINDTLPASNRDRTAYEEITHAIDRILGRDYLSAKSSSFSEQLLCKETIASILEKKTTDRPVTKGSRRILRKALGETKDTIPDDTQSQEKKWGQVAEKKLDAALDTFWVITEETELAPYTKAKKLFHESGNTSKVATEILAKTYANLLICRDRMQQMNGSFDLDAFMRYMAHHMPSHGKTAMLYCRARDEHLNALRRQYSDKAIANPEQGSEINPTYWHDAITDINKSNEQSKRQPH